MIPLEYAPPLGRVTDILAWCTWIVIVVCVASFLISAGKLGLALRNGGEYEGLRGLLLTATAAVVAGAAATIANALL